MEDEIISAIASFAKAAIKKWGPKAEAGGAFVSWDDLSELAGLEIVDASDDRSEKSGLSRAGHVLERNSIKNQFNQFCLQSKLPYRFFIAEHGGWTKDTDGVMHRNGTLILRHGKDVSYHEQARLARHLASRLNSVVTVCRLLADLPGLSPSVRRGLLTMADGSRGLGLSHMGLVDRLQLPAELKREVQEFVNEKLMPEEDNGEEDGE